MSAGRIVLLIFGILFVLFSFGLIIGGGVILAVDSQMKDSQGFYMSGSISAAAPASPAIVTRSADIHIEPGWFINPDNLITFKASAASQHPEKPIFIGIARESDLKIYLEGASYDEVSGFNFYPSRIDLTHHSGTARLSPPTEQSFWVVSATGTDTRNLQWDVTTGNYSLVIMNADGSAPVDSTVSLGIKIPAILHNLGIGLLTGGIIILVIGGIMIYFAARGW